MNEHMSALASQARDIRLAAQRLQQWARDASAANQPDDWPGGPQTIKIQRELGTISHNLNALMARFGKPDR